MPKSKAKNPDPPLAERRRLPDTRPSVARKITMRLAPGDEPAMLAQAQELLQAATAETVPLEVLVKVQALVQAAVLLQPPSELDIYVHVGLYPDERPGELFVRAGKMGETVSGMLDALAICISLGLQYGVPLEAFTVKLRNMAFSPAGHVTNVEGVRRASSLVDAVVHWLAFHFEKTGDPGAEPETT